MIHIAICDDSENIRNELKNYIHIFSNSSNIHIDISEFISGEQLLQIDSHIFDFLILDIQMEGINGLDVARKIRLNNTDLTIIFITNFIQYALEGYEVQAYRFFLKPISYEQFSDVVGKAIIDLQKRKHCYLYVKERERQFKILVEDILYIETDHGHVLIHTNKEIFSSTSSMKEIESSLQDSLFFRCHTGYLIPLRKVISIETHDVILQDNTKIPLSKHRRKDLKEKLSIFFGGYFL